MTEEILYEIVDTLREKPREYRWEQHFPTDRIKCDYWYELSKEDLFRIIADMDYIIGRAHLSDSDELYSMLSDELIEDFADEIAED